MDVNHTVTTDFTEISEMNAHAEQDAQQTEAALPTCSTPEEELTAISGGIRMLEVKEDEAQLLATSRLAAGNQMPAEEDGELPQVGA